jgi:hypothetical protein
VRGGDRLAVRSIPRSVEYNLIRDRFLLVLGAGSSVGYGYPTGSELISYTIDNLKTHLNNLRDTSEGRDQDQQQFDQFLEQADQFVVALRDARPATLDSFLARKKPLFDEIGKLAIALAMLNAEWRSGKDGFKSYHESDDNWQRHFFEEMCRGYIGPNAGDIDAPAIGIISFNYDRSLECAFYRYLVSQFNTASPDDVRRILDVKHAYGAIRDAWNFADYGKMYTFSEVQQTMNGLEVMYEGRTDLGTKIRGYEDWIQKFDRVLFLGFAYDDFNLANLKLPNVMRRKKGHVVFGTAMGLSERRRTDTKRKFKEHSIVAELLDEKCLPFIGRHL